MLVVTNEKKMNLMIFLIRDTTKGEKNNEVSTCK